MKKIIFILIILSFSLVLFPNISSAYPDSIAALGDSITRAANSDDLGDNPEHSWSTGNALGDNIESHYERLLDLNPNISGNNYNYAVSGAKMDDLNKQAQNAIAQNVEYVTILMGSNDACTSSLESMTNLKTFENQFIEAMDNLTQELPNAIIYVLGLPDIYQLCDIGKQKGCDWMWSKFNICQSLFSNSNSEQDRQVFRQRVIDYNKVLKNITEEYKQVYTDNLFESQITEEDISFDCFHPSLVGQQHIAEVSWNATIFYNNGNLTGDVNGDCIVNIFDLAKVGLCYGCTQGEGCWQNCSVADVKEDGKIDIFDLASVGINYGKIC